MVRAMPKWRRLQGVLCESLEPVAGAGHAGGGLVPGGGRGRPGPGHSPHHRQVQVQVKVGDKATEMTARIAGALKSARTLGHNLTHHTKTTKKEKTVNRRKSARQPCGRRGRSAHTP